MRFNETATETVTIEKEVAIECDICKKVFDHGDRDNIIDIQEFICISFIGGFGSVFGDGSKVEVDICQKCFNDKFKEFLRLT